MTQGTGPRRMPSNHLLLKKEMRFLLEENPGMSEEELKWRVLEARNLPTDPDDPYWRGRGRRRSTTGKFRERGEHFEDLFKHALNELRKGG